MTNPAEMLESTKRLLLEGIGGHLQNVGLNQDTLRHFDLSLTEQNARLQLAFPTDIASLQLSEADKPTFLKAFNDWAAKLATKSGGTFIVTADEPGTGLRQVKCTASSTFDMIQGINRSLCSIHQVDASFLGRGKH